ncbi:hypothetical protein GCM10018952_26920 [Streptosporangium vulgare]
MRVAGFLLDTRGAGGRSRLKSMCRISASRSGTRCTGVAVITRMPKPDRISSSGMVMKDGRMLAGGAETMKPIMPPAAETLSMPSELPPEGYGVPWTTCTTPSTPMVRADQPMIIRPVSAFWSG